MPAPFCTICKGFGDTEGRLSCEAFPRVFLKPYTRADAAPVVCAISDSCPGAAVRKWHGAGKC